MKHCKTFHALAAAAIMTTAVACEYKDLGTDPVFDNGTEVVVRFDWDRTDSIPQSMRMAFYNKNFNVHYIYDVNSHEDTIMVPKGDYEVAAWNGDTKHVYVGGLGKRTALYATTPHFNPRFSASVTMLMDSLFSRQAMLDYPDYMVHDNHELESIEKYEKKIITMHPDSMVYSVRVRMGGIAGLDICRSIRGAIGNMAGTRFIGFQEKTQDYVTIVFDANGNAQDSTVTADFYVFGLEPTERTEPADSTLMAVFFWTDSGNTYLRLNVTEYINKAKRDGSRTFIIDLGDMNIDLRSLLQKSMIDISVEEWNDEHHGLSL